MPFIVTPRHLEHRSELYHQLATLTNAGVGIIQAVELLCKSPPHRSLRLPLKRFQDRLLAGDSLTESAQTLRSWMPTFDQALLNAAEKSGRLDRCFQSLAVQFRTLSI